MALAGVDFVFAGIFRGCCCKKTHSNLPDSFFGLLFLNLSIWKLRAIKSSQENFNHDSHMNKAGYNINVAWLPMTLAWSSFVIENGILSFFLGGFVPFSCKYVPHDVVHACVNFPLGCFHVLSLGTSAAVKVGVHVSFSSIASSGDRPKDRGHQILGCQSLEFFEALLCCSLQWVLTNWHSQGMPKSGPFSQALCRIPGLSTC